MPGWKDPFSDARERCCSKCFDLACLCDDCRGPDELTVLRSGNQGQDAPCSPPSCRLRAAARSHLQTRVVAYRPAAGHGWACPGPWTCHVAHGFRLASGRQHVWRCKTHPGAFFTRPWRLSIWSRSSESTSENVRGALNELSAGRPGGILTPWTGRRRTSLRCQARQRCGAAQQTRAAATRGRSARARAGQRGRRSGAAGDEVAAAHAQRRERAQLAGAQCAGSGRERGGRGAERRRASRRGARRMWWTDGGRAAAEMCI